jgi:protein-tyrosine phosphatase
MFGFLKQKPQPQTSAFADIHCHMLWEIDDGSRSEEESLLMAEMAVHDGIETVILTPHQLGAFAHNTGDQIRERTAAFQRLLNDRAIPLQVLPGADVRIEPGMVRMIGAGDVLSLGDHGLHVLLELPHELYFPLERLLDELLAAGMRGILSHPERNLGLLRRPELIAPLVQAGCLMQITAGSLMNAFGPESRDMSEWMLREGAVHFVATDAHGVRSRRPLIGRAFARVVELVGADVAAELCCSNPAAVAAGRDLAVDGNRRRKAA